MKDNYIIMQDKYTLYTIFGFKMWGTSHLLKK